MQQPRHHHPAAGRDDRRGVVQRGVLRRRCAVPRANVVGEIDRGWDVVLTTLAHERGGTAPHARLRRELHALASRAGARDGCCRGRHRALRQRLRAARRSRCRSRGSPPTATSPSSSAPASLGRRARSSKLFWSELEQRTDGYRLRDPRPVRALALGERARRRRRLVGDASCCGPRSATIYAGTSEVQRNIIAAARAGVARGELRRPVHRVDAVTRLDDAHGAVGPVAVRRHWSLFSLRDERMTDENRDHRRLDAVFLADAAGASARRRRRTSSATTGGSTGTTTAPTSRRCSTDMDRQRHPASRCISGEDARVREAVRQHPDRFIGEYHADPTNIMAAVRGLQEHVEKYGFKVPAHRAVHVAQAADRSAATTRSTPSASSSTSPSRRRSATPARSIRRRPGGRSTSIEVALDFPELRIICGHIGWPWTRGDDRRRVEARQRLHRHVGARAQALPAGVRPLHEDLRQATRCASRPTTRCCRSIAC